MWKGNVWINRLYISGGTKQCKAVFQMTMSKVLQDMNLNLKRLAVTFTISPIEMSWVRVFFPLVFFLLCCTVLFFILFCLFNIIRNQMYLSCLFLPFSSCPLSPWNASQTSLHRQQNMGQLLSGIYTTGMFTVNSRGRSWRDSQGARTNDDQWF